MAKFCENCGAKLEDKHVFCVNCGQRVAVTEAENQEIVSKSRPDDAILVDEEGIYRWRYDYSMWKNPTLLITVWKVMMIGCMFPVLLVTGLALFEDGFAAAVEAFIPMILMMSGIATGLVLIAYPIVSIMNGGKYQVVFEMNETGINHIQLDSQFKKKQVLSWLSILAGAASGNATTAGSGLLSASKASSYSKFSSVKKIVAKKRRKVIYLNESLQHNQVYVVDANFDQVLNYIIDKCKKAEVSIR